MTRVAGMFGSMPLLFLIAFLLVAFGVYAVLHPVRTAAGVGSLLLIILVYGCRIVGGFLILMLIVGWIANPHMRDAGMLSVLLVALPMVFVREIIAWIANLISDGARRAGDGVRDATMPSRPPVPPAQPGMPGDGSWARPDAPDQSYDPRTWRPCPACATMNPASNRVCHSCGRPLY